MTVVPAASRQSKYLLHNSSVNTTYLAVSNLEASMGEKAWLLVRFIPVHGMRVTGEMNRVERDARMKDRIDGSV